jgi:threonine dehydrogenase-like Zn-dependent dehydrogenase
LLARFPLNDLFALDLFPNRRMAAQQAGARQSLDPLAAGVWDQVQGQTGIDLAYEVSGSPEALDQAIAVTGFAGRVVVGSWYGQNRAHLDLGGYFHRSRIRIISSQVSHIDPNLTGRWGKTRRFELAWEMIRQVQPERWITHRLPFREAAQGYDLLDVHPQETIQILLDYTKTKE